MTISDIGLTNRMKKFGEEEPVLGWSERPTMGESLTTFSEFTSGLLGKGREKGREKGGEKGKEGKGGQRRENKGKKKAPNKYTNYLSILFKNI